MRWIALLLILSACTLAPSASPFPSQSFPSTSQPTVGTCTATDQTQYVYHPYRLVVLNPCIRVVGTVMVIRTEADGDYHILVALDPAYLSLLKPANQGQELGDLVVEPVCEHNVTQTDAIATCSADHDPLTPLPKVGQHDWLEGRYVTDSDHGGWAELHPLYRWGVETNG